MADTGNGGPSDSQTTELKMRRALGLQGRGQTLPAQQRPEQARQRHRFVQDGGVPVVMLNQRPDESSALRERVAEVERQLELERGHHAATRRSLAELQANHQALETRLVHAELAHQDALAQERRALATAQQALNEALSAPARRPRPATIEPVEAATPLALSEPRMSAPPVAPKKRGRPRIHPLPEPKPVRWWTPSFRSKTKA